MKPNLKSAGAGKVPAPATAAAVGTHRGITLARVNPFTATPPRDGCRYLVLSYMRVSQDLQEGNFTFETQYQRICEKLDRVYGPGNYEVEVHQDDGLSGAYGPTASGVQKRTRPKLVELQTKLKSGRYDCFIIYKLNRLFRSLRWTMQWIEDTIIPSGVTFLSATEDLDLNTPQGRALIAMTAVMDAAFREATVEHSRDAQATRVEQGYLLGPPPYGWQYQPKQEVPAGGRRGIIPVPEQVPHVRFMVEKYLAGWGSGKIAGDLNQRGIPTSEGARWNAGTVLGVLNNPVHCGYVDSKRKGLLQGQHYAQRFYDMETYEEIQSTKKQRHQFGSTNTHKADSPHLVNGIARCARCGQRLYIFTGNAAYRAYRCQSGFNQGQRTCRDVTVRAEWIESAVEQEVERMSQEPAMRELLRAEAAKATSSQDDKLTREQAQLQKEVQSIQGRIERFLDALGRGTIDDVQFAEVTQKLRQEKQQSEQRLAQIEASLANRQGHEQWVQRVHQAVLDFPLCWAHLKLDERRQLLRTLVEKLTVDKVGRDAVLRLKLHLLPEREIPLVFQSTRHMKDRPLGVHALTRRQLVYLHYVGQGHTRKEVARLMGTTLAGSYSFAYQIRKHLGIHDLQQAYLMAKTRIEALLPNLPLGPTNLCKVHTADVPLLGASLMEVFPLLSQGASAEEVAKITGLTMPAVKARRKRILDVLQVESIFQATQKARQMGLL